jgi:hypothetical protein
VGVSAGLSVGRGEGGRAYSALSNWSTDAMVMVGGVVGGVEGEVWSCEGRLCGGGGGVEVPRPPGYEANPGESDEIGKVRRGMDGYSSGSMTAI